MSLGKIPAGLQKAYGANFEKVKNIIVAETGFTLDAIANVQSQAEWIKAIREDLNIWGGKVFNSYENTTDDPNTITLDSTKKKNTTRPNPSGTFYLDTNFCDTKEVLRSLKNTNKTVIFELNDNSLHVTMNIAGKLMGFSGILDAVTKGIAQPADVGNNLPLYFFSESYNEWENGWLIPMDFSLTDLILEYSPVGLNIYPIGAYNTTSGVITVQVDVRCSPGGVTGLVVADFEIVRTNNLTSPAITAINEVGNGNYELTIQKEVVPANLAVGDFFVIQVKKVNGLIVQQISNDMYISVNE